MSRPELPKTTGYLKFLGMHTDAPRYRSRSRSCLCAARHLRQCTCVSVQELSRREVHRRTDSYNRNILLFYYGSSNLAEKSRTEHIHSQLVSRRDCSVWPLRRLVSYDMSEGRPGVIVNSKQVTFAGLKETDSSVSFPVLHEFKPAALVWL